MTEADAIAWMGKLAVAGFSVPLRGEFYRETLAGTKWLTEARTALYSVFPPGHSLCRQWEQILERARKYDPNKTTQGIPTYNDNFDQAVAVVQAAWTILKDGRMRTLIDGVKAETVSEVLDQADAFLAQKHPVPAAVLAGGALETHLLHLARVP